jgi:hypothetical protein
MQVPDHPRDPEEELSLVELVNRVLDRGAVISGDVTISVAGIDLVYVGLRVLLASVESMVARENTGRLNEASGVARALNQVNRDALGGDP